MALKWSLISHVTHRAAKLRELKSCSIYFFPALGIFGKYIFTLAWRENDRAEVEFRSFLLFSIYVTNNESITKELTGLCTHTLDGSCLMPSTWKYLSLKLKQPTEFN